MKPYRLEPKSAVKILWEDSSHGTGWQYPDRQGDYDVPTLTHKIATIGFVVQESEEAVVISNCLASEGAILNALTIPWGCILQLSLLKNQPDVPENPR